MNERIKQLADEAGLKHHNWITNESNVKDGDFKYPRLEDYEKFAELIVKECVGVVEGGHFLHDQAPTALFAKECSGAIKRHFGVAE